MIKKWSFESQETFDNDFFDCLVSVLVWEEGPQVALHAVVSSNHSHLASWTKLGLQLVVTDSTHGMAAVALHDPRLMCHVLKANGAFWVDELHLLIETRLLTEFSRLASPQWGFQIVRTQKKNVPPKNKMKKYMYFTRLDGIVFFCNK